jgi:hypothetical protein
MSSLGQFPEFYFKSVSCKESHGSLLYLCACRQPGFKQMKILRQERHTVCFIEFEVSHLLFINADALTLNYNLL